MAIRAQRDAPGRFTSTQWSVVLAAGHPSSPDGQAALEILCKTYWYPLYSFLRRRGSGPEEAEDQTQAFFVHMLTKRDFRLADPEHGRFRSFLLASLKHFAANESRRARTQKRGGGAPHLSLDFASAEGRYLTQPVDDCSAELLFDRSWAITILDRTIACIKTKWIESGKEEQFDVFSQYLARGEGGITYAATGAALGMTEGAVKTAVYRLRRQYREILREQIAQTVACEDQVEEEVRDLYSALSR